MPRTQVILSLVFNPDFEGKKVFYIKDNRGRFYNRKLNPTTSVSKACIYDNEDDAYFAYQILTGKEE